MMFKPGQMSPELVELLAKAKALVDSWTPEEREEHFRIQRENYALAYRENPDRETAVVVLPAREAAPVPFVAVRTPEPDYRTILIAFCMSLTLADHMGDALEDMSRALKLAGIEPPDDVESDDELRDWLENTHGGVSLWELNAPSEPA